MLAIIMTISDERSRTFVEMVFDKYSAKMYMIAFGILRNHHDAEDCVNDTFVKIIDKIERFRQADMEGYLIKLIVITCRNTALNKYKDNQKRNRHEISTTLYDETDGASVADIPDYSADVERIVMNDFTCKYVGELVDKLDLKYRDVIVLKSLGYDNNEIAFLLNISEELVRQRYLRAKKMILDMGGDTLYEFRDK